MEWILLFVSLSLLAAFLLLWRRYVAMSGQLRKKETLFHVSMQLNSTIRKKELLRRIMDTAALVMRSEASSIILVDRDKDELYFEIAIGEKGDQVKEIRLRMGEGIAGWVAQNGEAVIVNDAANDARWSSKVSNKVGLPTRNLLCVPILNRGTVIGVLQVLNKRGGQHYDNDDRELLETIAAPTAVALENAQLYEALEHSIQVLKETTAAKERMESELKIAGDIQMSFLPKHSPVYENGRVGVYARLKPAKEVGGDFFNYYALDERHLFFTLGDVSDKGIPAALFMAVTMTFIKGKLSPGGTPAQLLSQVNTELCKDDPSMFATIFCGILNEETGELAYCDGGHNPPFLMRGDGRAIPLLGRKGVPLGVLDTAEYHDQSVTLEPGDRLLVYTDGITEAENAGQEQFTAGRLQELAARLSGLSNRDLVEGILAEIESFAEGYPQTDDIAILAIQRKNQKG